MGFIRRRRRSIKILPGVRVNLNSKSTSVSFGGKYSRTTISSTGKTTRSRRIPGTHLTYVSTTGSSKGKPSNRTTTSKYNSVSTPKYNSAKPKHRNSTPSKSYSPKVYKVCGIILTIIGVIAILLGLISISVGGIALVILGAFCLIPGLGWIKRAKIMKNEKNELIMR